MRYSAAISDAVKGEGRRQVKVDLLAPLPPALHKCPRCKCYDEINLRNSYEWLKPFKGYVQTPLCGTCIMELRRSQSRRK